MSINIRDDNIKDILISLSLIKEHSQVITPHKTCTFLYKEKTVLLQSKFGNNLKLLWIISFFKLLLHHKKIYALKTLQIDVKYSIIQQFKTLKFMMYFFTRKKVFTASEITPGHQIRVLIHERVLMLIRDDLSIWGLSALYRLIS